jgi:hypothetical protein
MLSSFSAYLLALCGMNYTPELSTYIYLFLIITIKNSLSLKKHNLYLLKFLPCDVSRKSDNMNGKNMNHQIHPVKR